MSKSYYQTGYDDGYKGKPEAHYHDSLAAHDEYNKGWTKGKEDKAFVDAHTDESIGIFGGFD